MISLRSKVTKAILSYFFTNPHAEAYVNALARLLELDPKNVHSKLIQLENEGLLKSRFAGKERFFALNRSFPLLREYRGIVEKTIGVEALLRKALSDTAGVKEAYIFGSFAKGTADQHSDIDVLAVGEHKALDLQRKLKALQKSLGREINVVSLSGAEMKKKQKEKDPFLVDVMKGKHIRII